MVIRILMTVAMVLVMFAVVRFGISRLFPTFFERAGRRALNVSLVVLLLTQALMVAARALGFDALYGPVVTVLSLLLVALSFLFVSIPVWGAIGAWAKREHERPEISPSRRAFLRRAAGVVPVGAVATAPAGTVASVLTPELTEVSFEVPGLDPRLDGLTILQFSDVHLGTFIDVDQVQHIVDAAREKRPDMVALTGDIADDYEKFPGALEAINTLNAPLGVHACIGNHEIYRGRAAAESIMQSHGVRYHDESGVVVHKDGAPLYVCGLDDPARLSGNDDAFLDKSCEKALAGCPPDVNCKIVLSHRPRGFLAAKARGATLTLSGHTHGGQVALLGRSVFSSVLPDSYLLGPYLEERSFLYTSAGLGHWFPFRLGCPTEATLVTLVARAPDARAAYRMTPRNVERTRFAAATVKHDEPQTA